VARRLVVLFAVGLIAAGAGAAPRERAWQIGIVRDMQVTKPKFVLGPTSAAGTAGPAPLPSTTVNRTYVIETDELRLELKETTTTEAPALDVGIGDSVTFAIEKNTVYIKVAKGKEHALRVAKKIVKSSS